MKAEIETWCERDEHNLFEYYSDFNEWLESEEGLLLRENNGVEGLSQPSKALYAGDKEAYDQAFREYRRERRHEALNETYFCDQFDSQHWFDRNFDHLEQLIKKMETGSVVPFVGAGISTSGGFPSWKEHLHQQGRTAGIDSEHIAELIKNGEFEKVIEEIEGIRGRDVFIQEIRDVFSRTGTLTDTIILLSELFNDTVITTNYDRLLEQVYDSGAEESCQIISGTNASERLSAGKVSIIKLHGDIERARSCILSKYQYDEAYGSSGLDLRLPIPSLLSYHYKNSSLLFLGCSLYNDRTTHVFKETKDSMGDVDIPQHFSIEQAPEEEPDLVTRNAFLLSLGITPIWYEKECYEYVESLLRLIKSELRYRGVFPDRRTYLPENDSKSKMTSSKKGILGLSQKFLQKTIAFTSFGKTNNV